MKSAGGGARNGHRTLDLRSDPPPKGRVLVARIGRA
ncbi:hypothetical protein BJ928_103133 [Rhizobium sp. WW_1]|jgi:hypothetical protein|nr:hypothetical protein BJ928_103133 [Rhizobium sp. WW_1]